MTVERASILLAAAYASGNARRIVTAERNLKLAILAERAARSVRFAQREAR